MYVYLTRKISSQKEEKKGRKKTRKHENYEIYGKY